MMDNGQQENLDAHVKTVWRRRQMLHVVAGILALLRWGVLLFLVGMVIDWMTYMPAPGRVAIFLALLAVSVYKAWRCGWRHASIFNATHTALQIEEHHGGLESLLVTAVQAQGNKLAPGTSESLQEMTCRRAEQAVTTMRPEEIIHYRGLGKPLTAALALMLIIVVFAFVNGRFLVVGVARIFPPWSAVKYPTRTQIDLGSGDMVVKEGNPALIRARVWGVIPGEAKLALRTGKGKPRLHKLAISKGECEYPIESAFRGFEYHISAGDARSEWRSVEVISSPRIQRAEVSFEFPSYTDRPTQTVEALTVTVPEGTHIKWQLTLDRAVSEANYIPAGGDAQTLDVSPDGRTVTMEHDATESRAYSFSWVEEEHGFFFASPSHYLQVAPDQPPRVELTSPEGNLYATLGRKINLAFRGRDDHGIGESVVAYRVNKIEEQKVRFPVPQLGEDGEQAIDWDYRSALPNLAIGDTVSFVVELTDRYPGPEGAHRARSQARRVLFLSKEDYLAQIARQKRRLLSQLLAIYREERGVHEIVRELDPSEDVFIQKCQLEAVRQDLMRERLGALKGRMVDLLEDLAANNIKDEAETAALEQLVSDMQAVADEHVGRAASTLRELAVVSDRTASAGAADPATAAHMVDSAARELGCLVLQLGFNEATEVMAREIHAIAQTQAFLRLQTILSGEGASTEALANAQGQLAQWLTRLFGTIPQDKESTIEDALVAFNLSRLIKELLSAGVDVKMLEAAALIHKTESDKAVRLQADVIKALLKAEFRLRVGSEHEALVKADGLFMSQMTDQKNLREAIATLTSEQFNQRRSQFGQAQAALHMNLHLLLMPTIPAPRPRLFDIDLPPRPPVDDLLAAAESAMERAVVHIHTGERENAAIQQQQTEESFEALAEIVRRRIEALAEKEQVANLAGISGKRAMDIGLFEERQLSLLERTEDAADDKSESAFLAQLQQKLAEDVERFRTKIVKWNERQATPSQDVLPLLSSVDESVRSMINAVPSLKNNQPDKSIAHQDAALEAFADAASLLERQLVKHSALLATLEATRNALAPASYVADIQAEQRDLVEATGKAKEADLPRLAIVQKNLVHAVNAVLASLDPLAHQIESGTVFLFAKEDMDAAAIAIAENDLVEAADAGSFVAESLQDLLGELQTLTPQYSYVLEVNEFFHEIVSEGALIDAEQGQLHEQLLAAPDDASLGKLIDKQHALESRATTYGDQLLKATGSKDHSAAAGHMSAALSRLAAGDKDAAMQQMKLADNALSANTEQQLHLMELLSNVLKPPVGPEASAESLMVLDVLALASQQKVLYRKTQSAAPKQTAELAAKQLELAKRGEGVLKEIEAHAKAYSSNVASMLKAKHARMGASNRTATPLTEALGNQEKYLQNFFTNAHAKMNGANKLMLDAASKLKDASTDEAINCQHESGELLRHLLLEYISEFLVVPGPAPPADPAVTDPIESLADDLMFFSPGAVSGSKPKGGRQEWQVLGRRDRAALNENFARELPLEYRGILKDYFERLAK